MKTFQILETIEDVGIIDEKVGVIEAENENDAINKFLIANTHPDDPEEGYSEYRRFHLRAEAFYIGPGGSRTMSIVTAKEIVEE